jgi:glycosyltransferase involved in cell wall biosynthesis
MQANDIMHVLLNSSVFVLPTYMDNSPNSLAEAMALGIPSISTKVGGVSSMIVDKEDGILIDAGDVKALIENISILLTNATLQKKLSVNAKKHAFIRNYPEIVAKRTIKVYHAIVNAEKGIIDETHSTYDF